MPGSQPDLMSYLRVMVGAWKDDPRDDAELLGRYAESRDETAFAALVWRHGTIVWRTCRHVLGDTPDVEDAFQSVFMALSRKAGRFPVSSLAGWLHRVARRAALDIQASARRRKNLEQKLRAEVNPKTKEDTGNAQLYAGLDEELAGLPEKLRVPLLLHYMEGKSQVEVARIVGCARNALQKRLAKGEAILRERLERRGLTWGAISVATLLEDADGAPTVPGRLVESTTRAAVAFRAGTLKGVTAEGGQKLLRSLTMKGAMQRLWWAILLCAGSLGVGSAGLVAWIMFGNGSDAVKPAVPKSAMPEIVSEQHNKRVELYGDPLPEGALARIGTTRFCPGTCLTTNPIGGDTDVAFLPDGKTLISTHGGNTVYFWEAATGKELRRLEGPWRSNKIAVSLDGRRLAIEGSTGKKGSEGEEEIWCWDLGVNPPHRLSRFVCKHHREIVAGGAIAFTADGKMLACNWGAGLSNGVIKLFDVATGHMRQKLNHKNAINSFLSFSRDGKMMTDGYRLWNAATWQKRHDLEKEDSCVVSSIFSPDNKMLVTVTETNSVMRLSLWDTTTGAKIRQIANAGGRFLAFLPDGQTLLVGKNGEGLIRFWDPITGKAKTPAEITCGINLSMGHASPMCLSSDGKRLAVSHSYFLTVWDIETGRQIGPPLTKSIHGPVLQAGLAFTPDDKHLATLELSKKQLQLWETETGCPEQEFEQNGGLVNFIDMSCDDRRIKGVGANGDVVYWDFGTRQVSCEACQKKLAEANHDNGYAVSSEGRWELRALADGVTLVDRSAKKEDRCFPGLGEKKTKNLLYSAVSADGETILFCYRRPAEVPGHPIEDHSAEVWSTATGKQQLLMRKDIILSRKVDSPVIYAGEPYQIALSPDGRWIAAILHDKTKEDEEFVQLWEVASGMEGNKFKLDTHVNVIVWASDGHFLAGGDKRGDIQLWDVPAGLKTCYFTGHRGDVTALKFSSSGRRLASGSLDTTVLIWDLCNLPRQEAKPEQLPSADELWAALQKKNVAEAWRSIQLLTQNPNIALPLLRERLRQVPVLDPKVTMLVDQLDDDDFHVRTQAQKQLEKMGAEMEGMVVQALEEALAKKPSVQRRQSTCQILEKISFFTQRGWSARQLQAYRAIEVLERIGTPTARQVLEELSRLPIGSEPTRSVLVEEAKIALQHLAEAKPTIAP